MKPKHLLLLALGVSITYLGTTTMLTTAETAAPPRPAGPEKLAERVDALDSRMKTVEEKSDRAALEKDYVNRIQKQYEAYYEKAFNTQVTIVSVIALFITIVFGLAARLGFGIFDRSIQQALSKASTDLETKFNQKLDTELQKLREANATQIKQLEGSLAERINGLEGDLKTRSNYQFQFAQGLAVGADKRHDDARGHFRRALYIYKSGKPRHLFEKETGVGIVRNIFVALEYEDMAKFRENAKKELADKLYNGLEDELALAALRLDGLAPLLKERKEAPTGPPQS